MTQGSAICKDSTRANKGSNLHEVLDKIQGSAICKDSARAIKGNNLHEVQNKIQVNHIA
jgi:hypothetical protein